MHAHTYTVSTEASDYDKQMRYAVNTHTKVRVCICTHLFKVGHLAVSLRVVHHHALVDTQLGTQVWVGRGVRATGAGWVSTANLAFYLGS